MRRYGEWMREEALRRIGHLYPKAQLPDGGEATVIAWIWARTVTCPNPACGIEMPLVDIIQRHLQERTRQPEDLSHQKKSNQGRDIMD